MCPECLRRAGTMAGFSATYPASSCRLCVDVVTGPHYRGDRWHTGCGTVGTPLSPPGPLAGVRPGGRGTASMARACGGAASGESPGRTVLRALGGSLWKVPRLRGRCWGEFALGSLAGSRRGGRLVPGCGWGRRLGRGLPKDTVGPEPSLQPRLPGKAYDSICAPCQFWEHRKWGGELSAS